MQEIVKWLAKVEEEASALYQEASLLFQDDPIFAEFLSRLSSDEDTHAHLMHELADYLEHNHIELQAAFELNSATTNLVESPLRDAQSLVASKDLPKKQVVELITKIEFLEWNNILFRYVFTTLKPYSKKFQNAAAIIQDHEEIIQRFIDALPEDLRPVGEVSSLPTVWQRQFLVVDDEEAIRVLLSRILARRGIVETARNGQDALAKVKTKFFDAVIADVDMPVMNGLKFLQEAIQDDPSVAKRFVFCTSQPPDELALTLGVRWVLKPFSLPAIDRAVDEVLTDNLQR